MRKKLTKLLCATICLLSLAGCKVKEQPKDKTSADYIINENRDPSGYKYDWKDFFTYNIYGSSGTAYIEVTPKEIKSNDFDNDQDFIAIQSVLNKLNLTFSPNKSSDSKLSVSPSTGLKTGDVVTFSLTTSIDSSVNMYTGEYEIRIPELEDSKTIDLFSDDLLTFCSVGDSEIFYLVNKNKTELPEELLNNLVYTFNFDKSSKLEIDKSILNVTVGLNSDFLKANGFSNITTYLNKLGYEPKTLETKLVLHDSVNEINFITERKDKIIEALLKTIENAEIATDGTSIINQICSIQKFSKDNDPFTYYVIYQDMNSDGETFYFRRQFRAFSFNDQIYVVKLGGAEQTKQDYATNAYEGAEILLNNMIVEMEETVEGEEPASK